MSDASLLIKPKIGLLRKVRDGPFRKELRRHPFLSRFIGNVLCAFFTEFKMRALAVRLRPGASRAIDSLLLIQLQQRPRAIDDTHLAPGKLCGYEGGLGAA